MGKRRASFSREVLNVLLFHTQVKYVEYLEYKLHEIKSYISLVNHDKPQHLG